MVSMLAIEANFLVAPALVVFLLFAIPIPGLSKLVARFVSAVEAVNLYGFSLLVLLTLATGVAFASALNEWRVSYSHGKPRFSNMDSEANWERRKWRKERDMYLHAVCMVLFASLMKFSRLHLQIEEMKKKLAGPAKTTTPADKSK